MAVSAKEMPIFHRLAPLLVCFHIKSRHACQVVVRPWKCWNVLDACRMLMVCSPLSLQCRCFAFLFSSHSLFIRCSHCHAREPTRLFPTYSWRIIKLFDVGRRAGAHFLTLLFAFLFLRAILTLFFSTLNSIAAPTLPKPKRSLEIAALSSCCAKWSCGKVC